MNRFILCSFIAGLLACGVGGAVGEDWNVYFDASAVHRITCIGDSLWCATNGGILLFDLRDSTFTHYIDGLGFRSSDVSAVTVDGNGSVWAGFISKGIVRIDDIDSDPLVKQYSVELDLLLSDSITALAAVGDDVYYGSTEGVAKFYDNFHSREPGLTDKLEGTRIYDIFPAGDTLWIGCEDGVVLFDRSTLFYTLFALGPVKSLCTFDGAVYCAGDSGTLVYDGADWSPLPPSWEGDVTLMAISSGGGELICATDERVYRWNGVRWAGIDAAGMKNLFTAKYRINYQNILTSLAVDDAGTPWVGGILKERNRGVYIAGYVNGNWRIETPGFITHNDIVAIDVVPGNGVWISTSQYGISYLSMDDRVISYTTMRKDPPYDPANLSYLFKNLAILHDSEGYLWCHVLENDLDMMRVNDFFDKADDEWAHFSIEDGRTITSNRFVRAVEDPAGNRWFLSDDEKATSQIWGINITSPDTMNWLSVNPVTYPEMSGGSVFDCAFDERSAYLALRDFGAQEWFTGGFDWPTLSSTNGDFWRTIIGPTQLTSTEVWAIELDASGAVWLGTSSGVVRYRAGIIDSLTKKQSFNEDGLIGAIVHDLELDRYGAMWVATESGLNRIDADGTIEAFTTAEEWRSKFQFIHPSSVISPLPEANCRALRYDEITNILWVATSNGLAKIEVTPPATEEMPLSELILYPNPVHVVRGDRDLRIWRISAPVDIEVYTLEGELVHEVRGVAEGEVAWDLLTLNGYSVRSGVYIVRVRNDRFSEVRKVAVIR